jgi:hypothetical protein
LSADGDRNVVDGAKYIASGVALNDQGDEATTLAYFFEIVANNRVTSPFVT